VNVAAIAGGAAAASVVGVRADPAVTVTRGRGDGGADPRRYASFFAADDSSGRTCLDCFTKASTSPAGSERLYK
jgi:hypothetical protein